MWEVLGKFSTKPTHTKNVPLDVRGAGLRGTLHGLHSSASRDPSGEGLWGKKGLEALCLEELNLKGKFDLCFSQYSWDEKVAVGFAPLPLVPPTHFLCELAGTFCIHVSFLFPRHFIHPLVPWWVELAGWRVRNLFFHYWGWDPRPHAY